MMRVLLLVVGWLGIWVPVFAQQSVQIGIVLDGPWTRNEEILSVIRGEIQALTREAFDISFPPDKQIEADWTLPGVAAALDKLLNDSAVSVVIASGVLASQDVIHRGPLPKPVVAPFVLNPTLQDAPLSAEGSSGVPNLSYIAFPSDAAHEVKVFHKVIPFEHLALLYRPVILEAIPGLKDRFLNAVRDLDISVTYWSIL